ncbi:Pepco domain-containing protein [Trichothermofontia sp.]
MADTHQLWIVAETEAAIENTTEIEGRRSGEDTGSRFGSGTVATAKTLATRKRVALDAQALNVQMENMIAIVNDLFSQADTTTGLRLDEVELSVEINAEGQISLVGNGGKLGNSGGITLKFTRPQ